jgi:hypothetical protein
MRVRWTARPSHATPSIGDTKTDYKIRAVVARVGLTANTPKEAVYLDGMLDVNGERLTGAKRYTMTFQKTPPYIKPAFCLGPVNVEATIPRIAPSLMPWPIERAYCGNQVGKLSGGHLTRRSYLTRFHTTTGFDPAVSGFGTRYFSSSPESSSFRFCAVPDQFGNIECSTCHVSTRSASLRDHLPQWEKFPITVVLYSSGVAFARSPSANFGCPAAAMCSE